MPLANENKGPPGASRAARQEALPPGSEPAPSAQPSARRDYEEWRREANAYLSMTHEPYSVARWALDTVLCCLRHSGRGGELWTQAASAGFWEAAQ